MRNCFVYERICTCAVTSHILRIGQLHSSLQVAGIRSLVIIDVHISQNLNQSESSSFTTMQNNRCISLQLVYHAMALPMPPYDQEVPILVDVEYLSINLARFGPSGLKGKNRSKTTTDVFISLFINRVSAVDENKEEIALDVFMNVYWEDYRVFINDTEDVEFVEITWDERNELWVPDLYIRQLREMKVLALFQEMTSIRLYRNSTLRASIGETKFLLQLDESTDVAGLAVLMTYVQYEFSDSFHEDILF
ncbi:hypothetical protein ANN_21303 [Periplaneta americana]|uniref:Neurotransmitter-gated ion-channel ligand-binding domain-containing protein n=1 Tax=Periplaneta americana TaxID=6978 RepID=A0ABQ8SFS3_PERAM|nr:hypothetical protein ANN_21303 [Periplaneta americana]